MDKNESISFKVLGNSTIWRTEDKQEEILIGSVEELYNEIEKSIQAGFQKRTLQRIRNWKYGRRKL
jgi:hypothetical protein